ncbi:type 4 pilus major pilin [Massilia sp. CT11-108]|uniref:type 4 pilus major pilin n=1 Tax=Massilia sp. CT11-108 TaxID=3393900 RepID=UPI0039A6CC00
MFATMPQRRARLARLHRQRGASLLEAIAYLGVAAIVVLAAVSLLQNAFGSARANQTTEELTGLRTTLRKMYSGQPYKDAEMLKNMITAKAIPGTLSVSSDGAAINNTWGGTVTPTSADDATFTITYTNVPPDVCMTVVSGATGWTKIADGAGNNPITVFPAAAASAAKLCGAAANTVAFTAN